MWAQYELIRSALVDLPLTVYYTRPYRIYTRIHEVTSVPATLHAYKQNEVWGRLPCINAMLWSRLCRIGLYQTETLGLLCFYKWLVEEL